MNRKVKRYIVFILASLLICVPYGHAASGSDLTGVEETSGAMMAADAILIRPFGMVAVVLGTAVFIVSLPFSALGGNMGQAAEKLVKEPLAYTFARPLGDL